MKKNDVKVGLDYSTAIAILQIKCATLVHVSVPERLQETLVHVSVLNVFANVQVQIHAQVLHT